MISMSILWLLMAGLRWWLKSAVVVEERLPPKPRAPRAPPPPPAHAPEWRYKNWDPPGMPMKRCKGCGAPPTDKNGEWQLACAYCGRGNETHPQVAKYIAETVVVQYPDGDEAARDRAIATAKALANGGRWAAFPESLKVDLLQTPTPGQRMCV